MARTRRPTRAAAVAQHEGEAPALRRVPRYRVQLRNLVRQARLRGRDALAAVVGERGDLVAEHFVNRLLAQELDVGPGAGAVIQEHGQDLWLQR